MRGLNLGSKPAEWNTSTTTTKNVVTNFQTTTSWSTDRSTSKRRNTTRSTTKSTTTSWTTSQSTTTSFTTSRSTTTSYTTTWSTNRSTTTTWSTSKSTTTSWTTSKSTTTSWTTSWSTSTTTTASRNTLKTTYWTASRSTATSFPRSRSTTTGTHTVTTQSKSTTWSTTTYYYANTSQTTDGYVSTSRITQRSTGGGGGGGLCIVEKQLVHVSTYKTTEIGQVGSGSIILEMDTPFNNENVSSYDELFEISSSVIDNGGGLQTGSITNHMIFSASGEIVNLNQYDLLITGDHPQPIFRSGSWMVSKGKDIQIGDGLYHISGSYPTGSFIWVWDIDIDTTGSYIVHKLDTEPHDVFFVNGFLTHNKDKEPSQPL